MKVLCVVLIILLAIGLIRLKGFVEYSQEGLLVQLRVLWFRFTLFPPPPKPEQSEEKPKPRPKRPKQSKPPKEKPKDDRPLTEKIGGLWSLFRDALPLVTDTARKLLHKLRVDELVLHLTWAAADPADAAMGYGAGQAALGAVWPLLEQAFNIRRRDVGVAVDFDRAQPILYARAQLSFSVGQLVCLGVVCGCKALALLLRHRPKRKKKGAGAAQSAK